MAPMTTTDDGRRTAFRTCPLCEAGCGLEITLQGSEVVRIRGDRDDVFSHGYICPKGSTLKQLHEDPDRIRTPLVKRDGKFEEASWAEAFAEVERRLSPILDAHGRDSAAVYIGNPSAHSLGALLYGRFAIKGLGSSNVFSASTVDQRPKELSAGLMFGLPLTIPVPDVDRTDYLLMLGANPYASNGSLATAPDWPGRLEALRARGGKLVVVDPRRSRTAEAADEHIFIRPGTDAFLLMAMLHALFEDDLVDLGRLGEFVNGLDDVERVAKGFSPEAVEAVTGVDAVDDPAPRRGAGRGADRVRLRTDRHDDAGVRHARELAGRRPQRVHGQPRSRRRRDVHQAGDRLGQHPRQAADRAWSARRPAHESGTGVAGDLGGVAGRRAGRGDRDPRRRTDPCAR